MKEGCKKGYHKGCFGKEKPEHYSSEEMKEFVKQQKLKRKGRKGRVH